MASGLKIGGTWRDIAQASVKVGGAWETVSRIYAKTAGAWEEVWVDLFVDQASISVFNVLPGGAGTSVANVRLDSDGDVYESNAAGTFSSTDTWLVSGAASEVWCSRGAVSGGSLASDPWGSSGTRLQMTSDRVFGISQTGVGTTGPVTFDITWHDAASGGNVLETTSVSLTASVEV